MQTKWIIRLALCFLGAGTLASQAAHAQGAGQDTFIVDISSRANTNEAKAIKKTLQPGSYRVEPIGPADGGKYTAWNAWSKVSGCDANNVCNQGWITNYNVTSAAIEPIAQGSTRYKTAELALQNATATTFCLNKEAEVNFFTADSPVGDNSGGMSLRVVRQGKQCRGGSGVGKETFIVNIASRSNWTAAKAVKKTLPPGEYTVEPVGPADGGQFTAWNAWSKVSGCDANNVCKQGWLYNYNITSAEIAPITQKSSRYKTAELALQNAAGGSFCLNKEAEVSFFTADSYAGDNKGGVSLRLVRQGKQCRGQPAPAP